MAGNVMPQPKFVGLDSNGDPIVSGKLYAYAAGTANALDTYTTSALDVANANPVVLDSAGRATVYLSANAYKFVLKTSADVEVWTQDAVQSLTLQQTLVGETTPFFGDAMASTDATGYPSGTTVDKLIDGTKVLALDSADLSGDWALRGMLRVTGGTGTVGIMNLSDGAEDTALVEVTSTSTAGESKTSGTITFAAGGASKDYGLKVKSSANGNYVFAYGLELVRTA